MGVMFTFIQIFLTWESFTVVSLRCIARNMVLHLVILIQRSIHRFYVWQIGSQDESLGQNFQDNHLVIATDWIFHYHLDVLEDVDCKLSHGSIESHHCFSVCAACIARWSIFKRKIYVCSGDIHLVKLYSENSAAYRPSWKANEPWTKCAR